MATWVTFSNGIQACQTGVYQRELAYVKALKWPVRTYGSHDTEYIDYDKMTKEQRDILKGVEALYIQEEAQAYIDWSWPGQGITIIKRESLPYGYSHNSFGSGGKGGFFCMQPTVCAGHSSCPRRYACSE